ncbi:MAG: helix-turn-helix domain-containing protein [Hyphomicrobiaceae bacterium]
MADESDQPRLPVFFYKTETGHEPVREWLRALDGQDRKAMKNRHWGSGLDDFLKQEGIDEEAKTQVAKEIIAWQIRQAMKEKNLTKKRMAELMETSRTQVDRLLNPKDHNVTLATLEKAAAIVGKRLRLELVPDYPS